MEEVTVPPRKKREMTEKQKAGLSLGLAALKAKREAVKAEKDAKKAGAVAPAAPVVAAVAAPAYVSLHEFASFRDDILKAIKPAPAAAAAPTAVVAPAAPAAVAPKVLTGSELLDKIYFS